MMADAKEQQFSVLVIDDDKEMRDSLAHLLSRAGWLVNIARRGSDALQFLANALESSSIVDVVLSDVRMPEMSGLKLLENLQGDNKGLSGLPVVLISAHGDIPMAVEAMQLGAYSFIEKPFDPHRLLTVLKNAARQRRQGLENERLRARLLDLSGLDRVLLGRTPAMETLREDVLDLSSSDMPVMLLGETGTGKELVARALHDLGTRAGQPFIAINCAAILLEQFEPMMFGVANNSRGMLAAADGGTLFLDEITTCSPEVQAKLLRAIETQEFCALGSSQPIRVNFRLISASNDNFEEAVKEGRIRQDLLFRLNNMVLQMVPLRDRRDDISYLFGHFLNEQAAVYEIVVPDVDADDLAALLSHDWPGNVRELRHVAERRVLAAKRGRGSVAEAIQPDVEADGVPETLRGAIAAFEKNLIGKAITNNQGRMDAVAEALGIGRRTLNEKIVKLGLNKQDLI